MAEIIPVEPARVMPGREMQSSPLRLQFFPLINCKICWSMKSLLLLACLWIGLGLPYTGINLLAQDDTLFTVEGYVLDEDSLPYVGIQVGIYQLDRSTITDARGYFRFDSVPYGLYALVIDHPYEKIYKTLEVQYDVHEVYILRREIHFDEVLIKAYVLDPDAPLTEERIEDSTLQYRHYGQDIPLLLDQATSAVTTSDAGHGIGYTGIRIRGVDPTRINVTINGIPWNDPESHAVYWVDLPDLAQVTDDIYIQRGSGTSIPGVGSFGANILINTNRLHTKSYLRTLLTTGSFGTRRAGVYGGTGLLEGKYSIDASISHTQSNGYIDRATADLRFFTLSATRILPRSYLKLNILSGHEVTGLAWYGVPRHYVDDDSLRTFNTAGTERSPDDPYPNTVDNYRQTHYQLFYHQTPSRSLTLNTGLFYTRGKGFYEQYRSQASYREYMLSDSDTVYGDLVRRKWLDNHFIGITYQLLHQSPDKRSEWAIGGITSLYLGRHFGEVIEAFGPYDTVLIKLPKVYYDNDALKFETSHYIKWQWAVTPRLRTSLELQQRHIRYRFQGFSRPDVPKDTTVQHHFILPKAGLSYRFQGWTCYMSYGKSAKEPTRSDYTERLLRDAPAPEYLNDFEFGVKFRLNHFQSQINLYAMEYRNQLIPTGKISDVGEYIRINVPYSYRRGVELSVQYQMSQSLQLQANATLSRNRVREFVEYIDNWDTGQQLTRTHQNTPLAFSPERIAAASASYTHSTSWGIFRINPTWKYVDDQYLDNTGSVHARIPAYHLLNLHLHFERSIFQKAQLRMSLHLINLLNRKYVTGGWIYRFYTTHPDWIPASDKAYITDEGDGFYNYSALYPQATRHGMVTFQLEF